uniref:SH2 domain-containing protein n=1 Tax=Syphacia muris TaxID=451379 RepID=A0A0N5AKJ7_9BILA
MSFELQRLKKRLETDDLHRQHWYWGNVSKEVVAKALENCEDGAFIVRDASTENDYTLTVKFQKKNRLIKIRVINGRCGFSEDSLNFDSLISLINYFKRNSLIEYNRMLDLKLQLPVSRVKCKLSPWVG